MCSRLPAARARSRSRAPSSSCGNAGTFLDAGTVPLTAAVAAAGKGTFVLDGVERMRERPIEDLIVGLKQLGVDAECTLGTGCPPVKIEANGIPGGRVEIKGSVSSQYLTAVLMSSPLSTGDIEIVITDTSSQSLTLT